MSDPIERNRIFEYITKKTWLHFEDDLRIGKLRLFAGLYQAGQGSSKNLAHYIDVDAARPLLLDMQWSKPIEYKEFKGTNNGTVTSRTLKVNTAEKGYYVELTSGPGKATPTGAVMPKGKPTQSVSVFLPFETARQIAMNILEYLTAVRSVNVLAQAMVEAKTVPADQLQPGSPAISDDGDIATSDDDFDKMFPKKDNTPLNITRQYQDGTKVDTTNTAEQEAFDAYKKANQQKAPASTKALRDWYTKADKKNRRANR